MPNLYDYARGFGHPYFDDAIWELENIESFAKHFTEKIYEKKFSDPALTIEAMARMKSRRKEILREIEDNAESGRRKRADKEKSVYRKLEDMADSMAEGL